MKAGDVELRKGTHMRAILLGLVALFAVALVCPSVVEAQTVHNGPAIHPPTKPTFLHGTVVGARTVPAYALAIHLEAGPDGKLRCEGGSGPIATTQIYRVATTNKYFDLLRFCGGSPLSEVWKRWDDLHQGETVVFHVRQRHVKLSKSFCESLGLIPKFKQIPEPTYPMAVAFKSRAQYDKTVQRFQKARAQFNNTQARREKTYNARCVYEVTMAHVRKPNDRWLFRVIDAGPVQSAHAKQIGAAYSASLAPAIGG